MKKTTVLALALSSGLALGFLGLQAPSFGQDKASPIRYEVLTRDGKTYSGAVIDKGGTLVVNTDDGAVTIEKSEVKSLRRLGQPTVELAPPKPLPPLPAAPVTPTEPPVKAPPAAEPPAKTNPPEVTPPAPPTEALPGEDTPAEEPPAEAPKDEPPAEQPPAEQPPAEQPPAEQPPAEQPPVEAPPAEAPPAEQPPVKTPQEPPAEQPPAETPKEEPPAETPPSETPPAEAPKDEPPAEAPKDEAPPAETPKDEPPAEAPQEQPPAEQAPTEEPPAEAPKDEPPAAQPPAATPEAPPADEPPKKPRVSITLEDRVIEILTRDERRITGRAVDTGASFRVATKDGLVEVAKSEVTFFTFKPAPADAPPLPRDALTRPIDPPEPGPKTPVVAPEPPTEEPKPSTEEPKPAPPVAPEAPPVKPPLEETPKVAPPGEPAAPAPAAPAPAAPAPAAPAPAAPAPASPAPASTTPAPAVKSEPAVGTEARAELSLYKESLTYDELIEREEEEFGPIDFDYRGPLELTLSGGAYIFDGGVAESKLDNGGSGSARLTFNLSSTNSYAFELYFGMTRTNYRVRLDAPGFGTNPDGSSLFNRNKAFIYFGDANIVFRPSGLAFDYAQFYLSIGGSIAYFDRFRGASPENDYGYGGNIEFGLDYKLDRTWSLKLGAKGRALYSRVLRDRDADDTNQQQRIRYIFEPTFGIVIHFE